MSFSFLCAGCDVIETVTYQASIEGFCQHLSVSEAEARQLMRKGVEVATQARDAYWSKQEGKSGRWSYWTGVHRGEVSHLKSWYGRAFKMSTHKYTM